MDLDACVMVRDTGGAVGGGGGADALDIRFGAVGGVVGGGGGGGAAGDRGPAGELLPLPKAFFAALTASETGWFPFAAVGGGGGVDLEGGIRGTDIGGGAEGGGGALEEGMGGAESPLVAVDVFLKVVGGAGGRAPGRGGGARGGIASLDCVDLKGISEKGRATGFSGGCLNFATKGFGVDDSGACGTGRRPGNGGGLGADPGGGLGVAVREVSGSDTYVESLSAPVSTPPPRFLSFGMPPAKSPPS